MSKNHFDVLIVGGGIAGLSTAITAAQSGASVAIISKVHPLRSHSCAAQGGIAAPISSVEGDNIQWHLEDTIRGGQGLCDMVPVQYLTLHAEETIEWLASLGVPFSRTPKGTISQRLFGGHTKGDGTTPIPRTCHAADRTGLAILDALWHKAESLGVNIFSEYYTYNIIVEDITCKGVETLHISTGRLELFTAPHTVLATGGYGQVYDFTTNPLINTGDGQALVLQAGGTLQDMELLQFHPTALYPKGHLISEAVRAEGGILRNHEGNAFMKMYAPKLQDLAPRDIVSGAMVKEMQNGASDHLFLDINQIPKEKREENLPQILELLETFSPKSLETGLIPIAPAAHYSMGGIPVTINSEVLWNGKDQLCNNLYAVGECACLSVHGANRLGGNSLLEAALFGRKCGKLIASIPQSEAPLINRAFRNQFDSSSKSTTTFYKIKSAIQKEMNALCGIIKEEAQLLQLETKLETLQEELQKECPPLLKDNYNGTLRDYLETTSLLDVSLAICRSALERKESRGAFIRSDFPKREIEALHTLYQPLRSSTKEVQQ